jgi:hypothetical protein
MPQTPRGMFGTWAGGSNAYSPTVDAYISHWDPNAVSGVDGCEGSLGAMQGRSLVHAERSQHVGNAAHPAAMLS